MTMWTLDDRYETMPWDELDAVVFDVGNVLLSYSPEEELEAFFPGETELHEKLMEKIIKTPYWNMMDRGTLTVQQAIGHMTGRDRALEPMIRRFMENWLDFTRPIEEGVQAVKSCLTHGKRVFKMSPFHHHLEMGGWTGHKWKEKQIVALFAGVTVLFAVLSFIGVFHRFGA